MAGHVATEPRFLDVLQAGLPPSNTNEVMSNAVETRQRQRPRGRISWARTDIRSRPTRTCRQRNWLPREVRAATREGRPIGRIGAYDSVNGVGDPRARQLSPAEMHGEPEPNDVPPWAADQPTRGVAPFVIGTTLNTVSRFLPPWLQAGIAAGRVMWPTPTAPPSMDGAAMVMASSEPIPSRASING